jgi:hypothetical protein
MLSGRAMNLNAVEIMALVPASVPARPSVAGR